MAENVFKPRGTLNAYKPDSGGAFIRSSPVFGIVKDNIDPVRAGRLKVYISGLNSLDPENSSGWVTVRYMTNFFGSVRPTSSSEGSGDFKHNPSSYGEWHAPPDIGTTVICVFVNGDVNYGFYIGCVPDPETLHMVPAIGATFTDQQENVSFNNDSEGSTYGGAPRLPTTNMNTNNQAESNKPGFITATKPVHSYTAAIMEQQGIIRDPVRGPISSSAQREPSSRVGWGVSTPGRPIYEGGFDDETIAENIKNNTTSNDQKLRVISRRGGHSIVMDDGDVIGRDQLVRIRTAKGHQILMSDDGQTLMVLHSNGQSYIELGKEGTVDIYSTNSINLRTHGDLNLHADNDLNIHAAKNLNIHAENMNIATDKSLTQSIGMNLITSALGMVTTKVLGAMSLQATGIASFSSTALTFINGGLINLNTGKSPIIPLDAAPTPLIAHTDTLFDNQKGFTAAPGKLMSVTSRAPAHAPWAHAGQGVDIKVDLSSSSQLPQGPSSALSNVVQAGLRTGAVPARLATALSSPTAGAISKSLNSSATTALIGATAQQAASGPLSSAIQRGASVVNVGSSRIAAIGAFAQSPAQLASAGVLKPGSDRLINSLVSSGANITQAMPNTLFTGNSGAENLSTYTRQIQSQTNTVVTTLRQSQTALTNTGVITGREASGQIAGVIFSGVNSGLSNTVTTVRTVVNKNTTDSSVLRDIGLATASVTEATNTIEGFGGISQAVNAMSISPSISGPIASNTGIVGSTFSAINLSFPSFRAGVATNLGTSVSSQQIVSDSLSNVVGQASADVISKLNPVSSLGAQALQGFTGTSLLESTNIASGIINMPGGLKSIASFTDKALPNLTSIPGSGQISSLVTGSFSSAMNNLPLPKLPGDLSSLTSGLSGGLGGITSGLSGGLGGITGSLTGGLGGITSGLSGGLAKSLSGLPIGSIAGAMSAISAVKSLFGGKGKSRTLSVAVNTTNRESINQKTVSLLGDPGIPNPTFTGEVSRQAVSSLSDRSRILNQIIDLRFEILEVNKQILELRQTEGVAILTEEQNSPAGDPGIKRKKDELQAKLDALSAKKRDYQARIDALTNNLPQQLQQRL